MTIITKIVPYVFNKLQKGFPLPLFLLLKSKIFYFIKKKNKHKKKQKQTNKKKKKKQIHARTLEDLQSSWKLLYL